MRDEPSSFAAECSLGHSDNGYLEVICERQRILSDSSLSEGERVDRVIVCSDKLLKIIFKNFSDRNMWVQRLGEFAAFALKYFRSDKAKELLVRRIELLKEMQGEEVSGLLGESYESIADAYRGLCEYGRSLRCYELSMGVCVAEGGDESAVAALNNKIGLVYMLASDYVKAKDYFVRALGVYEKLREGASCSEVVESVATLYNNLAVVEYRGACYEDALKLFAKSYALRRDFLSLNHSDTAESLNNIGNVYFALEDYPKAMNYYRAALDTFVALESENSLSVANCCLNLSGVSAYSGAQVEALEYSFRALSIFSNIFESDSPRCNLVMKNIKILEEMLYSG